jgi:hypothetical protein
MDRKPDGIPCPETTIQLSAFEISLDPKLQVTNLPKNNHPSAGNPCPICQLAKIDYDSMLNLSCSECGYTLAGCFT